MMTASTERLLILAAGLSRENGNKPFTLGQLADYCEQQGERRSMRGMKAHTLPALKRRGLVEEHPMGWLVNARGAHLAIWLKGRS